MVLTTQYIQVFTVLSSIIFLYFFSKWLFSKSLSKEKSPPSPPKLPILGNLHQLGTHPHRALRSISESLGEFMLLHVGSAPMLVVSSARVAREIMRTNDVTFASRLATKTSKRLLYNCKDVAAAPYGEYWRQMKSICVMQLLSNRKVRSFRTVREEETDLLMGIISKAAPSAVNLSDLFKDFTTDVLCRVAFGRKFREEEHGTNFKNLVDKFTELLGQYQIGNFVSWLSWVHKIDGWETKVEKVATEFDRFLEHIIQEHEHRKGHTNVEPGDSDDKVKDFVDVLLGIHKENESGFFVDRDGIKGLILDMFAAGTDTTSAALEWAMTELLRNPKIMEKLQREVRSITGEKTKVEEDDLEQMRYLKAVIKETLRLYPSIPLLPPRLSTQAAKINGYEIKSETLVVINTWAIQRDPTFWDEPEKFSPERFLNHSVDFRGQDFELIPFGAGRRMCPGISFAVATKELVLANLVHKFDWTLPIGVTEKTLDMSECIGLTIHRKTPLLAVATAHQHKK